MATVRLTRVQCLDDDLPQMCAKCGAEDAAPIRRTFVWSPAWILLTIFLSLPVLLIVYLVLRKKMVVHVPLCGRHVNEWRRPALFGWVSTLSSIGVFILGVALLDDRGSEAVGRVAMIVGGVGFLVSLVALATWNTFIIRPTEITHDDITLTGVDPEFADAVRARRKREYRDYEDDDRPRRKARPRDEYEDRPPRETRSHEQDDDGPRRPERRDRYEDDEYDDRRRDRDRDRD